MVASKKKKKPSAAARAKSQGRSLVWSTYDEGEKRLLRSAAGIAGISMSELVRSAALAEAKKIIEKFRKED